MSLWPRSRDRLARLARRAAEGDAVAFRRLYRELYPVVWSYVSRRIHTNADAEDLVARVFHRMVEHLPHYDATRGSVKSWVLTMARNAIIDHLRARRPTTSVDELHEVLADVALHPEQTLAADEQVALLRAALAGCSAEVRQMFGLRFGDGLRIREIAELMGLSEAAVKQRFARTLRELRAQIHAQTADKGATGYAI